MEVPQNIKNRNNRTSLMVQWMRIRLPMQGTRAWPLVREDPTCRGETVPQLLSPLAAAGEARAPRRCAPQQGKPSQQAAHALWREGRRCSLQLEKSRVQHWRPSAAKNKRNKGVNSLKKGFFIEMSCSTAIPLWGIYPKEMESDLEELSVLPSSLQHYSQKYGNNLCRQWVGA